MAARNSRNLPDCVFVPGDEVYLTFPSETPVMGILRTVHWETSGLTYDVLWPDRELTCHPANELCHEGRVVYGTVTEDE